MGNKSIAVRFFHFGSWRRLVRFCDFLKLFWDEDEMFFSQQAAQTKAAPKPVKKVEIPVVEVKTQPPPVPKPVAPVVVAAPIVQPEVIPIPPPKPPEPPKVNHIYLREMACSPVRELMPKSELADRYKVISTQTIVETPTTKVRRELPPDHFASDPPKSLRDNSKTPESPKSSQNPNLREDSKPPERPKSTAPQRQDSLLQRSSTPPFGYSSDDFYHWVTNRKVGGSGDVRHLLFSPTGKRREEILPKRPETPARTTSLVNITPTATYADPYGVPRTPVRSTPINSEHYGVAPAAVRSTATRQSQLDVFSISDPIDHFVWGRIERPTNNPTPNAQKAISDHQQFASNVEPNRFDAKLVNEVNQAVNNSNISGTKSLLDTVSPAASKSLPDYSRPDYNSVRNFNYFKPGEKYDHPPTV